MKCEARCLSEPQRRRPVYINLFIYTGQARAAEANGHFMLNSAQRLGHLVDGDGGLALLAHDGYLVRSEERRVGKECRL